MGLDISISTKYKITSDKDQYYLRERNGVDKAGNTMWRSIKFYGSINNILKDLPEYATRREDHTTLEEVKESILAWQALLKKELNVK